MSESPRDLVTVHTWIECGLRLARPAPTVLGWYREAGGAIRTATWNDLWKRRKAELIEAGALANERAA
jgi:hypothetical protein